MRLFLKKLCNKKVITIQFAIKNILFIFGLRWPLRLAIYFSYFASRGYFVNVFAKHTKKYETLATLFSYFMRILYFINAVKK